MAGRRHHPLAISGKVSGVEIMIFFWPIAFGFLLYLSSLSVSTGNDVGEMQHTAQVEVLGGQFLAYRSAALAYARANPTATGNVADSALALPNWLAKPSEFQAYVHAGESFVYFLPGTPRPSLADMGLYHEGGVVSSVGVALGGKLTSSTSKVVGRALPVVIPNGAIVYVN